MISLWSVYTQTRYYNQIHIDCQTHILLLYEINNEQNKKKNKNPAHMNMHIYITMQIVNQRITNERNVKATKERKTKKNSFKPAPIKL